MGVRLKGSLIGREADGVVIVSDLVERIVLEDVGDDLLALLELLADGGRTRAQLVDALADLRPGVSEPDVVAALEALDRAGLLAESDDAGGSWSERQRRRHVANLAFFAGFATLDCDAEVYLRRLLEAHVLMLGVGGLGSTCVMSLSGLGVGRLTLVDCDEVESGNLSRQFMYRDRDVGRPKVDRAAEWVRELDPSIEVDALYRRIEGPGDVSSLLSGVDLVVMAMDHPLPDIDFWVNEACVPAGVPFVRGGANGREIMYWSVDPGRSACRVCFEHDAEANPVVSPVVLNTADALANAVNPAAGPVISTLGSLVALEAMRYLSGFAPPAAAGTFARVDTCTSTTDAHVWKRWPCCPVCARAPHRDTRPPAPVAIRVAMAR